jgi:fructoselysine-6-P-deglycase FrlB-like protein
MRRALNLSSRSMVHEWSTVRLAGIRVYSCCVGNAAKAAKFLESDGYIGIAFAFAGTTNDVVNACVKGRKSECKTIAFEEYGKFGAST